MLNSLDDLCRLCISKDEDLLDLLLDTQSDLAGKVQKYLEIKCSKDDRLPHKICTTCVYELESFVAFSQRCHANQKALHIQSQYCNGTDKGSKSGETVKESVPEDFAEKSLRKELGKVLNTEAAAKTCDDDRSPSVIPVTNSTMVLNDPLKQNTNFQTCDDNRSPSVIPVTNSNMVLNDPFKQNTNLYRRFKGLDPESSSNQSTSLSKGKLHVKEEPGQNTTLNELIQVVKSENTVEQLVNNNPETSFSIQNPCVQAVANNGRLMKHFPILCSKLNSQATHDAIQDNEVVNQVNYISKMTDTKGVKWKQTHNVKPNGTTYNPMYTPNHLNSQSQLIDKSNYSLMQVPSQNANAANSALHHWFNPANPLLRLLYVPNTTVASAPFNGGFNVMSNYGSTQSMPAMPRIPTLSSMLASQPDPFLRLTGPANGERLKVPMTSASNLQTQYSSVNAKNTEKPRKKKRKKSISSPDESCDVELCRKGKLDHVCLVCDRGFSRKVQLELHMRVHMPSNNEAETEEFDNDDDVTSGTDSAYSVEMDSDSSEEEEEEEEEEQVESNKNPKALKEKERMYTSRKQIPLVTQSNDSVQLMMKSTAVSASGITSVIPMEFQIPSVTQSNDSVQLMMKSTAVSASGITSVIPMEFQIPSVTQSNDSVQLMMKPTAMSTSGITSVIPMEFQIPSVTQSNDSVQLTMKPTAMSTSGITSVIPMGFPPSYKSVPRFPASYKSVPHLPASYKSVPRHPDSSLSVLSGLVSNLSSRFAPSSVPFLPRYPNVLPPRVNALPPGFQTTIPPVVIQSDQSRVPCNLDYRYNPLHSMSAPANQFLPNKAHTAVIPNNPPVQTTSSVTYHSESTVPCNLDYRNNPLHSMSAPANQFLPNKAHTAVIPNNPPVQTTSSVTYHSESTVPCNLDYRNNPLHSMSAPANQFLPNKAHTAVIPNNPPVQTTSSVTYHSESTVPCNLDYRNNPLHSMSAPANQFLPNKAHTAVIPNNPPVQTTSSVTYHSESTVPCNLDYRNNPLHSMSAPANQFLPNKAHTAVISNNPPVQTTSSVTYHSESTVPCNLDYRNNPLHSMSAPANQFLPNKAHTAVISNNPPVQTTSSVTYHSESTIIEGLNMEVEESGDSECEEEEEVISQPVVV